MGRPSLYVSAGVKCLVAAVLVAYMALQGVVGHTHAVTRTEVGIVTSSTLLRMKDKDMDKRLKDIQLLGASWIRVDFNWPAIQPNNAQSYNWGMYDRVVRVAGAHNLKILGVLSYTPRWAQEPRCAKLVITLAAGQKCNPKDDHTFAEFARRAALRYEGKNIRAWELWNEPNLSSYWKTAQPNSKAVHADAMAYARLANAAAYQIRHAAPDTLIVTGGLAPLFEPKYPKGLRQSDYLAQLLHHLTPTLFDAVGIHPYSWPTLPAKEVMHNAFYSVDGGRERFDLRAIMEKTGFGHKQIWGTEFGAPTEGTSHSSRRPDHVTELLQAQIISQGIWSWYDKTNVGPLFVHTDSDQWLVQRYKNNQGSFGLRRRDGSEKPAYGAFRRAVAGAL